MFWDDAGSLIPNFRFVLRVDGMFDVPLKSVRAFSRENEYDYIQEGGLNDYVHLKRKPVSKPYTLVVERYIPTTFDDPLSNGTELTLPLMLFVGRNTGGEMSALSYARYYVFTGAVVMSKEYGQLDAEHAGLLTETMTIGYNMMFCVTSPADEISDFTAWQFNKDGNSTEGNTEQLHSKSGKIPLQNKMNKEVFKKSANLWSFDINGAKTKEGNPKAVSSRKKPEQTEASKEDMAKKASLWTFDAKGEGTKAGEGKASRTAPTAEELTSEDMAGKAALWTFDANGEGTKAGEGTASRTTPMTAELTKEEMIKEMLKKALGIENDEDLEGIDYQKVFTRPESTEPESRLWTFDEKGEGTKAGEGTASRTIPKTKELTKDEMTKEMLKKTLGIENDEDLEGIDYQKIFSKPDSTAPESRLWTFDAKGEGTKAGEGTASRTMPKSEELTKEQMAAKAKKGGYKSITDFLMG